MGGPGAALRDHGRDQHVVGKGPVQIDEFAAQIFALVPAWRAPAAGGAVADHHGVALRLCGAGGGADDGAGDLVAEGRRQRQHRWMAAAAEHLHVRTAGGGGVDPDQEFAPVRAPAWAFASVPGCRGRPGTPGSGASESRILSGARMANQGCNSTLSASRRRHRSTASAALGQRQAVGDERCRVERAPAQHVEPRGPAPRANRSRRR